MKRLFTSEAVTEGHPDKVCDQISDAVLDAVLEQDPGGRVACEACCTTGMVVVMGEISTTASIDIPKIVRNTVCEIGYDGPVAGFDGHTCGVMVSIDEQSQDIAMGADKGGAGDQGMMFGYACTETLDYMPLPITLANRLAHQLASVRKFSEYGQGILPDGKTQVTVEYSPDGVPLRVDTVVVSTQHEEQISQKILRDLVNTYVVKPVLNAAKGDQPCMKVNDYRLLVNPTGRFVKGGPAADTGLTGRKIIADTYGGYGAHGGGAFSGKDPSKVDRSGAYIARHIAKNLVASGICDRVQVQLAYAIGVPEPVSVNVNTFGTGKVLDEKIADAVMEAYNLTPDGIACFLDLRRPIYRGTAAYGHFGDTVSISRPWEQLNMAGRLKDLLK